MVLFFDLYWKYHNFERIEIRATVFLQWSLPILIYILCMKGFNSNGAPWCPTGTSEANSKRLRGCEKFKLPVWRGCSTAHQKGRPVDSSGKKQAKLHKFTRLFAQLHFPCPTLQHSFNVHTFINHQEISTTFQLLHCTWNLIMRLTLWLYLFRITWGIFQSFLLNINLSFYFWLLWIFPCNSHIS